MTIESFKISKIGNDLAQWPELDFVSKEGLQRIAKFVLSEVALAERAARVDVAKEITLILDEFNLDGSQISIGTVFDSINKIITANTDVSPVGSSEPVRKGEVA